MKRKTSKILGIILAVFMVASLLPGVALADGGPVKLMDNVTRNNAESIEADKSVTDYDLWVGGTRVTDANKDNILSDDSVPHAAVFDPEENVLTFNDATVSASTANDDSSGYSVYSDLGGNTTLTVKGSAELKAGIYLKTGSVDFDCDNITVTAATGENGIDATYEEDGVYSSHNVTLTDGNLTVRATSGDGIVALGKISVKNGALRASTVSGSYALDANNTISYTPLSIVFPIGGKIGYKYGSNDGRTHVTIVTVDPSTNASTIANDVLITEYYGVWFNGVPVTAGNKDNILNDSQATHAAVFTPGEDSEPGTLTLNGAEITQCGDFSYTGSSSTRSGVAAIYTGIDLIIDVQGENTVSYAGDDSTLDNSSYGIVAGEDAKLTFTGTGSLDVSDYITGISSHSGDLTVNGPSVNLESALYGVAKASGNLLVASGSLKAISTGYGNYLCSSVRLDGAGTISVTDGTLTASANWGDYGIQTNTGGNIEVSGTGWIDTKGGVGIRVFGSNNSITVSEYGSITAEGTKDAAISANNADITVKDNGNVSAVGTSSNEYGSAVGIKLDNGKLTIEDGGTVYGECTERANSVEKKSAITTGGGITMPATHAVTVPEDGRLSDDGKSVVNSDGSAAKKAKIEPFSTTPPEPETVATPTFSPEAGSYEGTQTVTISCETADATIYYTTDGTDPSASSTEYTGSITVSEPTTIKAIAVCEGMTDSEIATAEYILNGAVPPTPALGIAFTVTPPKAGENTAINGNSVDLENESTGYNIVGDQYAESVSDLGSFNYFEGVFEQKAYYSYALVIPSGDPITEITANDVTITGAEFVSAEVNEYGEAIVYFKVTVDTDAEVIDALNLTVTLPKDGDKYFDPDVSTTDTNYTISSAAWLDSEDDIPAAFSAGEDYTLKLMLRPEKGYIFADTVNVSLNGKTPVSLPIDGPVLSFNELDIPVSLKQSVTPVGGGSSSYAITPEETENGSVTVRPSSASEGTTATVTPTPNEGYEVDKVAVTDKNGNEVTVTDNGDGTYSFTMPEGKVTVTATFKEIDHSVVCPSKDFTDVDPDAWYHEAVDYVVEKGIMNGVGDNRFDPTGTTTRAMIVTILYRLEGEPTVSGTNPFDDVAEGKWYTDAVIWANENGIVDGYGGGKFGPTDDITREQFATILYRYAQFKGYDVSATADISGYGDASSVSNWAQEAMQWACGAGLIQGDNLGNMLPGDSATRAQAATLIMRFIENVK